VKPSELAFGAVVVPLLIGLAAFFGWRQVQLLRSLPGQSDLGLEDRIYLRRQAWRRLACSVLMLTLAGLLVGSFFLEGPLQQITQERAAQTAQNPNAPVEPEHRAFIQHFTAFWLASLLVLLVLLVLVIVDVRAIARFGQRHHRELRAELQNTLAQEVARLRQQRNGQG
jgi:hypothetical protein